MSPKVELLVNKIKTAAQDYYGGTQKISDKEFDNMIDELKSLDPENPILTTVGWGYDISSNNKEKSDHLSVFTGLPKIKVSNDFTFKYTPSFVITPKLDGGSVELQYKNGILMRALTRGNGITGVDCTEKLIYSQGVPTKLSDDYTGNVVGEYVLSREDSVGYVDDEDNQRNIPNGELNKNNADPDECKRFSFVAYRISYCKSHKFNTHREVLDTLRKYGFIVPDEFKKNTTKFIDCKDELSIINDKTYLLDGIVVNPDRLEVENNVIHYNGSRAYKTITETAEVKVKSIRWNFTRTGKYVPTLNFDPFKLSGATIENASGFNFKYVEEWGMEVGATVEVTRSGEIIPYVLRVIDPCTESTAPTHCAHCGTELVLKGKDLVCPNDECKGKTYNQIYQYLSMIGCSGIDNAGGSLLSTIIEFYDINNIEDIYKIDDLKIDELWNVDGLGGSKIEIIKMIFNNIKNNPHYLSTYLEAMNIAGLGGASANKIVNETPIEESLQYDKPPANMINRLNSLGRVSYNVKRSILDKWDQLHKISQYWNIYHESNDDDQPEESNLNLIKVCITGRLGFGTKKKFYEYYKNKIVESDINNCDYLICNQDKGSSKLKTAQAKGIKIVTENELVQLIS